jgi:AraC family transcriptional regulator of adaptative response/methylated-DNA-[protein]-cysteine methyltransferase
MNTRPAPDDARWQAVLSRDSEADGSFVYAVRSTGIFCRPSCAARRPRREQVLFFADPAGARQAGFRACRRCRPTAPPEADAIARACSYIDDHLDQRITLAALGQAVGLSPYHLQRSFKRRLGLSPRAYAAARRQARLKAELRAGAPVSDAVYAAGYGGSSQVYATHAVGGMTPAVYRQGGVGMEIRYTLAESPLGRLLVAATPRGLCAVSLGDRDAALEAALAAEYPAAARVRDDAGLRPWLEPLLDYLAGAQPALDLPLDLQASAFESQVWQALRAIPYGQTQSYGEIARRLGRPTAARAVAQACAHNPVALVIPCHRVVRGDGRIGGYRWGLERKQALLAQEREFASADTGDGASADDAPQAGGAPPPAAAALARA